MLVVIAIAASIIFVVSSFSNNANNLNGLITEELQSRSDIGATMQVMTGEIQSAGFAANGAYPIDSAGTSSFAFYSDITKKGVYDHIRYFLSSSTIYKGIIVPTGTPATYPTSSEAVTDVIDHVVVSSSSPLFRYFDSSYTGTQAPMSYPLTVSGIRIVNVSFYAVATTSAVQAVAPQYFSTFIDIRNLRSN